MLRIQCHYRIWPGKVKWETAVGQFSGNRWGERPREPEIHGQTPAQAALRVRLIEYPGYDPF